MKTLFNAGHMAPRTAREAAHLLAAQGKHAHYVAEHETVCVSQLCTQVPPILSANLLTPADTRPAGFRPGGQL
ncbi:hypothetical protein ACWEQC_06735 [Streptomyces shenzhenensis]